MSKHLFYFRPGEEARMLARCQFGLSKERGCGASLTYPIKGYPWRRNVFKSYEFDVTEEITDLLFSEVARIRNDYPEECLENSELFSDSSEKANGITRDRKTKTLCYTIGIYVGDDGMKEDYFALRENSEALLSSILYTTISKWIEPFEKL